MPGCVDELRVVGLRVQTGAHEHQLLRQPWKFRIERYGERQVRHWPSFIDGYLAGIPSHHPHEEVGGIFVQWFGGGDAFRHIAQLLRWVVETWSPCAKP